MRFTGLPGPDGREELALGFDQSRRTRLLVIPALFDEANKLRHFTVEVMRLLDAAGIDSLLPDLPGTNESRAPLAAQTLAGWRDFLAAAARQFAATHVLALRGGALIDPGACPALHLAPASGPALLRGLVRVQLLADKEAGVASSRDDLTTRLRHSGGQLAGHDFGPAMIRELEDAAAPAPARLLEQAELGGAGLWLRAEPAHDPAQAERLAALVQDWIG